MFDEICDVFGDFDFWLFKSNDLIDNHSSATCEHLF